MEVVINTEYGGFCLSHDAMMREIIFKIKEKK